jgi:hypothetical protein
MKPIPMSAFVPPVTGIGHASAVAANLFDPSGVFRTRNHSIGKRRRVENGEEQSPFDLTRDYPPLSMPPPLILDVSSVRALMVEAAAKVVETEGFMAEKGASKHDKSLAGSTIALFRLLEAVVEKAIIPMAENSSSLSSVMATCAPPREDKATADLRNALEVADRTAIIFDADLGQQPLANRSTLASNLTAGLRSAAISKSNSDVEVAAEAVRITADALSCATNLEFLGQSSKKVTRVVAGVAVAPTHCSMPVKLTFDDKGGRLHFERTLREKCGVRSTISLPIGVREEMKKFQTDLKTKYPEKLVMTRPDSEKLCFIAFLKTDGDRSWTLAPEQAAIDPACLNYTGPARAQRMDEK